MRKLFFLTFFIVNIFFISSAEGADWKLILTVKDSMTVYTDTESIRHISKAVVRAWSKIIFIKPESYDSKEVVELLSYAEYDCIEMKIKLLQEEKKYSDGTKESTTFQSKQEWYVRPDTLESAIHDYLCKDKK